MAGGNIMLEKVLSTVGGEKEFKRKGTEYSANLDYFEKNKDELLKNYDENWVAIHDSKLIAGSRDFKDVLRRIKEEGLPLDEVLIEFISSKKTITLFHK